MRLLPDAAFEQTPISGTFLCKETFLQLLTVLVAFVNIVASDSVARVKPKIIHPVTDESLWVILEVYSSRKHLYAYYVILSIRLECVNLK